MANLVSASNLGNVMPLPKGDWIAGFTYKPLNIVKHNGSTYIALIETTAEPSGHTDANWMLIVRGVEKAEVDKLGIVKPDGITITISEDGTITGAKQVPDNVLVAVEIGEDDPDLPDLQAPPIDADRLGGELPDYYATKESVTGVDNKIGVLEDLSIEEKNTIVSAINTILDNLNTISENTTKEIEEINTNKLSKRQAIYNKGLITNEDLTGSAFSNRSWVGVGNNLENAPDTGWFTYLCLDAAATGSNLNRMFAIQSAVTPHLYMSLGSLATNWIRILDERDFSENISNVNFFINPDFQICQRGLESYTTSKSDGGKYYPDRWYCYRDYSDAGLTFKIKDDGLHMTFTIASGSYGYIKYTIDAKDAKKLSGKTITISCNATLNGGNMRTIIVYHGSNRIANSVSSGKNGLYYITITLPNITDNISINFAFSHETAGGEIVLHWCKMELGSIPTQFTPPDPAEELMKCQRYYYKIKLNSYESTANIGIGIKGGSKNHFNVPFKLPVAMRTFPTCNGVGGEYTAANGVYGQVTNIQLPSYNVLDTRNICFSVTTDNNLESETILFILGESWVSGAYLEFDAEIY